MSAVRTIYLARHGATTGEGLFLGRSDPGLSDSGRRQARELAAELVKANLERVFASSLDRSRQTAEIVAALCGCQLLVDERLDEISYGAWDGLSWAAIERSWPELARRKSADWRNVTPPGGEPVVAFAERVADVWREITVTPASAIAIVGHAGVNAILHELAVHGALDWERALRFRQGHGEMISIELQ